MKIVMPIEQYESLLNKCKPQLPHYEMLRNGLIITSNGARVVEIPCKIEQAEQLLALAKQAHSAAASSIEKSIRLHREL
jgi:3-deoxy-D-arabino-heptulosonate 7-phosphate (DAHP) synthase